MTRSKRRSFTAEFKSQPVSGTRCKAEASPGDEPGSGLLCGASLSRLRAAQKQLLLSGGDRHGSAHRAGSDLAATHRTVVTV